MPLKHSIQSIASTFKSILIILHNPCYLLMHSAVVLCLKGEESQLGVFTMEWNASTMTVSFSTALPASASPYPINNTFNCSFWQEHAFLMFVFRINLIEIKGAHIDKQKARTKRPLIDLLNINNHHGALVAEGTRGGARTDYAKHTWGMKHLVTLSWRQNSVHFGVCIHDSKRCA